MANTYTQLFIQIIFSVYDKNNFIKEIERDELEKIMCSIVTNNKSKVYAIYCNPDHVHILLSLHPTISVSEMAEKIKSGSSNWLNTNYKSHKKFHWQKGFGAFSYSKSAINNVVKYILNQPEHHKRKKFKEEYLSFLEKFEVDFESKYLFDWYDDI